MKVLHINDYSTGGGAEVHTHAAVQLLRTHGVEAELFTSDDVPGNRLTAWRYINNRAVRRALADKLRSFAPDVVHLHNFYHVLSPGVLAELARWRRGRDVKIVMTAHDYHLACPNSGACWFAGSSRIPRMVDPDRLGSLGYLFTRRWDHRGLGYSTLKLAQHLLNYRVRDCRNVIDLVICPSRFMEHVMKRAGLKTVFVPNPVQTDSASATVNRQRALTFVFAGRIEPEKGLNEFLEMLSEDCGLKMMVIGDGSELERCRRTCEERRISDRITFSGRLDHDATVRSIAQCHVLVLPSLWWENCPMSLLEAISSGTNILVSKLGGMKEIVESAGVGYMFEPGDRQGLQAAIEQITQDHRAGRLNDFARPKYLDQCSERSYLSNLMQAYGAPHRVQRESETALEMTR